MSGHLSLITGHSYNAPDVINGILKFVERRVDLSRIKVDTAQGLRWKT